MSTGHQNGNTALARRQDAIRTVQDLLLKSRPQIQMALPSHLTPDRMIRVALTTIRQTPKLLECTPISLLKCVMQAAGLGLEPDPLLGRAYIVPFKDKKKGVTEATLIIGYKGLIDLARRSGEIVSIEAHVVHELDEFRYELGTGECLVHKPFFAEKRGLPTYAWAMARFKGGGHQFEVMDIWDLDAVRRGSKQSDSGPWVDHTEEMYRKTVVRRLAKFLPLSPQLAGHLAGEEMIDSGMSPGEVFGDEDAAEDAEFRPAPTGNRSADLAARIAAEKPKAPADLGWVHQAGGGKNDADDGDDLDGIPEPGANG